MIFDKKDTELILTNFELDLPEEPLSEEALFALLSDQIAYMIEYKLDFLLSLLYRMDVLEPKINFALSPACLEPANIALARLVFERQKERMATKQAYQVGPIENLEKGLEW